MDDTCRGSWYNTNCGFLQIYTRENEEMKKAIAIVSVIVAIVACVGVGILFRSSYEPAEKTAKKFMEAILDGDAKTAYKCCEDSLTMPYENVASDLTLVMNVLDMSLDAKDDIQVLTSNAVYEYDIVSTEDEASEEAKSEPTAADVEVTLVMEGQGAYETCVSLKQIDGKWYVSDFDF